MRCALSVVLSLVLVNVAAEVGAAEFSSPKGFTLTYPDGWQHASKEHFDLVAKSIGAQGQFLSMAVCGPPRDNFADNINVMVLPESFALDDAGEKELVQGLKAQLGRTVTKFTSKRIEINGVPALVVAYEGGERAGRAPLCTWQTFISGKKQSYVCTCTTLKSRWSEFVPVVQQTIFSLRIDPTK